MAVPTVYRWDDKNAPQVTNIHDWTQVKAWFQAIFVDGYLEDDDVTQKPGLGWGLSFDDATYRVYLTQPGNYPQQNTLFIELDFTYQCNGSNYYGCSVVGVWENTDKVNRIFANSAYTRGCTLLGQNDDDLKITPWMVVGTSRSWWNFCGHNHNIDPPNKPDTLTSLKDYYSFVFVGDYVNDGYDMGKFNQAVLMGHYSTKYITDITDMNTRRLYCYAPSTSYLTGIAVGRDINWNWNPAAAYHFEATVIIAKRIGEVEYPLQYPYPNQGLLIKPLEIYQHNDHVHIGRLPGAYYSPQGRPLAHDFNFVEFTGTGEFYGDKFIGVGDPLYSELYVNMSEDWGVD